MYLGGTFQARVRLCTLGYMRVACAFKREHDFSGDAMCFIHANLYKRLAPHIQNLHLHVLLLNPSKLFFFLLAAHPTKLVGRRADEFLPGDYVVVR